MTSKNASEVATALVEMLIPYQPLVRTITADNSLEFAEHQRVAKKVQSDIYFADPYASYQRGASENANGLLRKYIPKGANLRLLTDEQLAKYQQRLNQRPRKILGFKQTNIILNAQLAYTKPSVTLTNLIWEYKMT